MCRGEMTTPSVLTFVMFVEPTGGRFNNSIRLWTHDVLLFFCQRTLIQLVITSASLVRTALQRELPSAPDSAKYTTKACKTETLGMQSLELLPGQEERDA